LAPFNSSDIPELESCAQNNCYTKTTVAGRATAWPSEEFLVLDGPC